MQLLANDLSIHEQFHDISSFQVAVSKLMRLRELALARGRDIHCHSNLLKAKPLPSLTMSETLSRLSDRNQQRAIILWLTHQGPFWDDLRQHSSDEYLEANGGVVVTDTALGEAAFRNLMGIETGLVSFTPSKWNGTPVCVNWLRSDEELEDRQAFIDNWWEEQAFKSWLDKSASTPKTWNDLRESAPRAFPRLVFGATCFTPMQHMPVALSAIERCRVLLSVLNELAGAIDQTGARTAEGHAIYQKYFTGETALFSDSSQSEKHKFEGQLTFEHPNVHGQPIFCPWHGKIQHQNLRIHYSWLTDADQPVYIAYVGPKLTRG